MQEIIRPGLTLFAVTLIAAVLLGFVYSVTKEPIALREEATRKEAMQELISSAEDFKEMEIEEHLYVTEVYEAMSNGSVYGHIINVKSKGFGGDMIMLVAIDGEGAVAGIKILDHTETPGLGAEANKEPFLAQYIGSKNNVNAGEIQAVTSSTITTNAVTKGVDDALAFYNENIRGR